MTSPPQNTAFAVRFERIPLDRFDTEEQVRRLFDVEAIEQLARSLKAEGQLQPVLAYERLIAASGQTRYVIIAGERRLLAARSAELDALDAAIFPAKPSAAELIRVQLVENHLREGLKPGEAAKAFQTLLEMEGLNATQLAARLNVATSTITRATSLLGLEANILAEVDAGKIPPAIAREIARIPAPDLQRQILDRVKSEKLKGDAVQRLVSTTLFPKPPARGRPKTKERAFKLQGGAFDAVLTPKRILLQPTAKRFATDRELLESLIELVDRLKLEVNQQVLKSHA